MGRWEGGNISEPTINSGIYSVSKTLNYRGRPCVAIGENLNFHGQHSAFTFCVALSRPLYKSLRIDVQNISIGRWWVIVGGCRTWVF